MIRILILIIALNFTHPLRNDVFVQNDIYKIHYSEILEQPTSVEYSVKCTETKFSRKGLDFYEIYGIKTSSDEDYLNNEWDKGHMAPAADFSCNEKFLKETFSYVNCALQHQKTSTINLRQT